MLESREEMAQYNACNQHISQGNITYIAMEESGSPAAVKDSCQLSKPVAACDNIVVLLHRTWLFH